MENLSRLFLFFMIGIMAYVGTYGQANAQHISFHNDNTFDVVIYSVAPQTTEEKNVGVLAGLRSNSYNNVFPIGTQFRIKASDGKLIDTFQFTKDGDVFIVKSLNIQLRIRNNTDSDVFLFTVDPVSKKETAEWPTSMMRKTESLLNLPAGALYPNTEWRAKDASGKTIATYFTTTAPFQDFEIAQSSPTPPASQLTQDQQQVLDEHNKERQLLGLPLLVWDPKLAQYAQERANILARNNDTSLTHPSDRGVSNSFKPGEPIGENLYYSSNWSSSGPGTVAPLSEAVLHSQYGWLSEKKSYNYSTNTCTAFCGHYTQMVWRATQLVGCAKQTTSVSGWLYTYIACEYYPAGNTGGKPY